METNLNESVNIKPLDCVDCVNNSESKDPFLSFVWYITLSCVCFAVIIMLMAVGRLLQLGMHPSKFTWRAMSA